MNINLVFLVTFKQCWSDHSTGLMARWFDGCPGYAITTDRMNEFDFTLPYLDGASTFAVLPGNPPKFDPLSADYSKFAIGKNAYSKDYSQFTIDKISLRDDYSHFTIGSL